MSAMDNATRNAGDMIKSLTLGYNRQRQAQITKELIEIISGAEMARSVVVVALAEGAAARARGAATATHVAARTRSRRAGSDGTWEGPSVVVGWTGPGGRGGGGAWGSWAQRVPKSWVQ